MATRTSGGLFEVEDIDVEQQRLDRREIVPTGPMFGYQMWQATGEVGSLEQAILSESDLELEAFRKLGKIARGTRRHNLIFIEDHAVEEEDAGIRLSFQLPKGAYATVVLEEVLKLRPPLVAHPEV